MYSSGDIAITLQPLIKVINRTNLCNKDIFNGSEMKHLNTGRIIPSFSFTVIFRSIYPVLYYNVQ